MEQEKVGEGRLLAWAALPEAPMRAAEVARFLVRANADDAVLTLESLIRGAVLKTLPALGVYGALIDARPLATQLGEARLFELFSWATETRAVLAAAWLRLARQPRDLERVDRERFVHRDLRKLTLGERRSLARRAKGDALKKLLVDPDPMVIRHLLTNGRTTESEVLVIASRRPTLSAPLETVLTSRFGQRYRVRTALAKNPHLAEPLAQNLLPCLDRGDLTAIRDDGLLSAERRLVAQRLLDVLDGLL